MNKYIAVFSLICVTILSASARAGTGDLLQTFVNPSSGITDHFAHSLAVDGSNLLVGAWGDDAGTANAGAAHLFDLTTGQLTRSFLNPTPDADDACAYSVALAGNIVALGAPWDDAGATNAGAVHLFDSTTGDFLRTLQKPSPQEYDYFGHAVAIVGDNIFVGAPQDDTGTTDAGAAYLFSAATGQLLQTFANPSPQSHDFFGGSVAALGNNVLVSAKADNTGAYHAGAAYLFSAAGGNLIQTFLNPDPHDYDEFGYALAGFGTDRVLIGAPYDDTAAEDAGSVYLLDANNGNLLATYQAPTPQPFDYLGSSVASSPEQRFVIVGAPGDDSAGLNAGAAHVFFIDSSETLTLHKPEPDQYDSLGHAVAAAAGDQALAATPWSLHPRGVAYSFHAPHPDAVSLQLVPVEDPGGNIPLGYRTYDVLADVKTTLIGMEMVVQTPNPGGIYQDPAGGNLAPDPALFATHPSVEFDSYVTLPVDHAIVGPASNIDPGSTMLFDDQNINAAWAPSAGQQTGPGTFHVARLTVSRLETSSYAIMGFQTGDLPPARLEGTFEPQYLPMVFMMVEAEDPQGNTPQGYTTYDFLAFTETNLAVMELLLETDQPGSIYQDPNGSHTEPNPGFFDFVPALEFDSYVTMGAWDYPTPTTLVGAAVDIRSDPPRSLRFDDQVLDVAWAPSGGAQSGYGLFHIARVTLKDTATGSWTVMGWQTGGFDAVVLTGTILLPGDVDGDGFVGGDDLSTILTNWGLAGATRDQGDLDGDGFVGGSDYSRVLTHWGAGTPPQPVPEPATLCLILTFAAIGFSRP